MFLFFFRNIKSKAQFSKENLFRERWSMFCLISTFGFLAVLNCSVPQIHVHWNIRMKPYLEIMLANIIRVKIRS